MSQSNDDPVLRAQAALDRIAFTAQRSGALLRYWVAELNLFVEGAQAAMALIDDLQAAAQRLQQSAVTLSTQFDQIPGYVQTLRDTITQLQQGAAAGDATVQASIANITAVADQLDAMAAAADAVTPDAPAPAPTPAPAPAPVPNP